MLERFACPAQLRVAAQACHHIQQAYSSPAQSSKADLFCRPFAPHPGEVLERFACSAQLRVAAWEAHGMHCH